MFCDCSEMAWNFTKEFCSFIQRFHLRFIAEQIFSDFNYGEVIECLAWRHDHLAIVSLSKMCAPKCVPLCQNRWQGSWGNHTQPGHNVKGRHLNTSGYNRLWKALFWTSFRGLAILWGWTPSPTPCEVLYLSEALWTTFKFYCRFYEVHSYKTVRQRPPADRIS